jgi:hypothetical protein
MVLVINRQTKKKDLQLVLKRLREGKGFDAAKHCGQVHLKEHPLVIQKRMRDEWE